MKINVWIMTFGLIFLLSCSSTHVRDESRNIKNVEISLDSVFINYYEKKVSHVPPYVFFYYTISNKSEDTIVLCLRFSEFEKGPLTNEAISIYKQDTFELFRGDLTVQNLKIKPQDSVHIDLNPSSLQLMDYYEKNKGIYQSEQDFLYDYALYAINFFSFNNEYFIDSVQKRKIIFRDPNDTIDQVWK